MHLLSRPTFGSERCLFDYARCVCELLNHCWSLKEGVEWRVVRARQASGMMQMEVAAGRAVEALRMSLLSMRSVSTWQPKVDDMSASVRSWCARVERHA